MRVGIIGAGNIGGNVAQRLAGAGKQVTVSFARDQKKLSELADRIGAVAAEPSEPNRTARNRHVVRSITD